MPSYKYRPQSEKVLKSFQINNFLDFRKWRHRSCKSYDFSTKQECALSLNEWNKLRIHRISQETHDTKRFTLQLPNTITDGKLNLPIASCVKIKGYDLCNKTPIIKKYTPISDSLYDGFMELVIKYYADGLLTPYLFSLNEGDEMELSGPIASALKYPFSHKSKIGMIAGGTGIAPFIQILKEMALHQQYDTRFVDLLYANKTVDDYLCQSDLMSLKAIMKDRLNINDFFEFNTNQSNQKQKIFLPNSWNPNVPKIGRIDMQSMTEMLPKPSDDILIMLCGTPGMVQQMYGPKTQDGNRELNGYLAECGYTKDMIHVF
eukprot:97710_1